MLWYRGSTGRRGGGERWLEWCGIEGPQAEGGGGEGWLECCGIEGPQVEGEEERVSQNVVV